MITTRPNSFPSFLDSANVGLLRKTNEDGSPSKFENFKRKLSAGSNSSDGCDGYQLRIIKNMKDDLVFSTDPSSLEQGPMYTLSYPHAFLSRWNLTLYSGTLEEGEKICSVEKEDLNMYSIAFRGSRVALKALEKSTKVYEFLGRDNVTLFKWKNDSNFASGNSRWLCYESLSNEIVAVWSREAWATSEKGALLTFNASWHHEMELVLITSLVLEEGRRQIGQYSCLPHSYSSRD